MEAIQAGVSGPAEGISDEKLRQWSTPEYGGQGIVVTLAAALLRSRWECAGLRAELESARDDVVLAKNRGDYLADVITRFEAGFPPVDRMYLETLEDIVKHRDEEIASLAARVRELEGVLEWIRDNSPRSVIRVKCVEALRTPPTPGGTGPRNER